MKMASHGRRKNHHGALHLVACPKRLWKDTNRTATNQRPRQHRRPAVLVRSGPNRNYLKRHSTAEVTTSAKTHDQEADELHCNGSKKDKKKQ